MFRNEKEEDMGSKRITNFQKHGTFETAENETSK
jgi:hypothetical protein